MLEVPLYFIFYHANEPYYCTMERLAYIKQTIEVRTYLVYQNKTSLVF